MARIGTRNAEILLVIEEIVFQMVFMMSMIYWRRNLTRRIAPSCRVRKYKMWDRIPHQIRHMNDLIGLNDTDCFNNLRMNRDTFNRLCYVLRNVGGLVDKRYVSVEEQVAIFFTVLSHHTKMRVIKFSFNRSTQTINKHFHTVLTAVLTLHRILLANPDPVDDECTDYRWNMFKGCLGAIDGTYIHVTVPEAVKSRYRTRKGTISVSVHAACDRNMKFVYMLTGWEGSAADARILKDAITKPNCLKVPQGSYYLCDNGYANANGFLTPYKMVRYHLSEWGHGPATPQNYREYYNMKHSKARNVIERTFGLMKKRWSILRSPSFYPIGVQNRIILACGLIHNFIRNEMPYDPLDEDLTDVELNQDEEDIGEYIESMQSSAEWSTWRDTLAQQMYAEWLEGLEMDTSPVTEKSGPQRSRNDKNGRRGWSTSEEEVLANGMLKIVREGWRSENGFKTGYLNVLELYLNKHITNCNIKVDPHINSRITVWKRHYNSLSDMLGTTGVGCDWKSKLVEATDDQWDAWMKKDSNAKNIRNRIWPLYEKWCEIFGTTRATGKGACDHNVADKQPSGVGGENMPSTINVDNTAESESHTDGVQMAKSSGVKNKTVGKKRKNMPAPDPFIDVMNSFVQTASTRLGEIAQRIGYEQDMSTARKKIFEFVQSLDCLTRNEKLRVTSLISRNPENLDVFFSLSEDDRVEWTLMVLRGEV